AFIILSGDLTLSKAKELCEKYYGGIAPAKQARRQRVKEPALESMVEITKTSARVAQPSVVLMMPAPTYDPENPIPAGALDLGIYGLSNSATGLLYRRLVEELKVATSFSLDYDPYQLDNTTITIVARSAPGISPEALKQAIQEEIKNFIEKGFTAEQLERLKTQSLSTLDYLKDSLLGGASHLVAPLIKHVPLEQIETWPEATKALKLEDVNEVLKTYLDPKYYVTGYLLPETGEGSPLTKAPQKNTEVKEPEKIVEDKGKKKADVPLKDFKKKTPPKKPSIKKTSPLKAAKKSRKKGIKHA
ncbi:MAG TPA: hypothetical protein DD412_00735, partial [Holosporales bacterium]|nr:hypothetical protein [Holosporales bacterium]